ncbi:MAG: hypothetical protein C0625_05695 [Arcobacter sp.]|nr:MAG: hypothetical protein C0625_05695 [Arcobacter sp.]
MIILNNTLKIFLLFGTILFCAIFIYSFTSPYKIEKHATGFIKKQIQYQVNEKIDNFGKSSSENKLIKFSQKILKKNHERINKLKLALKNKLPEKIASTVAIMQDLNCECRNRYSKFVKNVLDETILNLEEINKKIVTFMKMKYMQIVQSIINDFRIFSGSNLLFFLLALILLFLKPQANSQLTLVAGLLFLSTVICSYFYIFEQDWFYNIIYQDFFGYFYLLYMGIVFLFLCDIIFNKARITTRIINFIANIIGSAFQTIPC